MDAPARNKRRIEDSIADRRKSPKPLGTFRTQKTTTTGAQTGLQNCRPGLTNTLQSVAPKWAKNPIRNYPFQSTVASTATQELGSTRSLESTLDLVAPTNRNIAIQGLKNYRCNEKPRILFSKN